MHQKSPGAERNNAGSSGTLQRASRQALVGVPLNRDHAVGEFICRRSDRVQRFLQEEAQSFIAANYSRVFVLEDPDARSKIMGYYTLSSGEFQRPELTAKFEKKVPRGIPVPVAHIGFMGRCDSAPSGTGELLLIDAALRVASGETMGAWGISLHSEGYPDNEKLASWYRDRGFYEARRTPGLMYAPLSAFLPIEK